MTVDSQAQGVGSSSGWLARLGTLSILYIAVFLTRIGFGVILVLFPIYLPIPKTQSALAGAVTAIYPVVEGVSALPVGAYVDRKGRKKLFVAGLALIAILSLVIGLSNNLALVGGAHGLEGLAAAMVTVASLTMITDLTVVTNRGVSMGGFDLANLAGYGVGIVLGFVFSGVFAADLGESFLVVSAILGVSAVAVFLILREPAHVAHERRSLKQMYSSLTSDVAAILPVWFALTVVLGFYIFLPRIVARMGRSDLSESAPAILLVLVLLGAGAILFGRLSDKFGRTKIMAVGALGEIGFLLVLPGIFAPLISIPPGTPWIDSYNKIGPIGIVAAGLFFLGSALVPSILAFIGDNAAKEYRGSAMGLYSLMLSGGIAAGLVLAGIADDLGGVQAVFYSAAIIFSGLSLTSGYLLYRNKQFAKSSSAVCKAPNSSAKIVSPRRIS
ncbi:MAG TPA: MFS transporter [Candidatus Bathyarchaeia archaeon]|nr:MFS transporter [Candidatus Bathyarchaeia archaeon]